MTELIDQYAEQIGLHLLACGAKVTTAESCTGGGIAAAITSVPGSSGWFDYGFVTYSNQAKTTLLAVSPAVLAEHGAVSREVVCAMAFGAQRAASARFAVAVSGIAGPDGGTDDKPVGTVWLGWAYPGGVDSAHFIFAGDRRQVREQAALAGLKRLLELIAEHCT